MIYGTTCSNLRIVSFTVKFTFVTMKHWPSLTYKRISSEFFLGGYFFSSVFDEVDDEADQAEEPHPLALPHSCLGPAHKYIFIIVIIITKIDNNDYCQDDDCQDDDYDNKNLDVTMIPWQSLSQPRVAKRSSIDGSLLFLNSSHLVI